MNFTQMGGAKLLFVGYFVRIFVASLVFSCQIFGYSGNYFDISNIVCIFALLMTKIENREQYEWAVARVEQLLPLVTDETPRTDPYSIELELLSNLVADYSEENFSIGKPVLGDVIKLRMTELGITQSKLAEILGLSASRISDYITGKCEPTLKVARELSIKLDIAPAVVLGI